MRKKLPDFSSPTTEQLRSIYATADADVRNVVLEVIRLRKLIEAIDDYRETVQKAWSEEDLGKLVALEKLRILMQDERSRMGFISEYKGKSDEAP
jgi:hypothetical protein